MLVIYNDGWVDRFALWRGARNLGLSNDDISRKREAAFATIASLKAKCIAEKS